MFNRRNVTFWILGFFSFTWIVIRTGTNPKRLTYPCQQAAFPLASSWLLAVISLIGGIAIFRRMIRYSVLCSLVLLLGIISISSTHQSTVYIGSSLPIWLVDNPISNILVIDSIPSTGGSLAEGDETVPDESLSDPAMDTMVQLLDNLGTPLYKSAKQPNGLIGPNDVVVIKGNFQWDYRLGTNTDRIKGLIWNLLNHPEGFKGEILVCDNTQEFGAIDHGNNNSEDTAQSIIDVINVFSKKSYPVYLVHWKEIREMEVLEYSSGDYQDGYIYDDVTKISYPKFRTPSGEHYVSLRYGIWESENQSYEPDKLSIINFPVLKAHGMAGATIAIKNWIGVLTTANETSRYQSYEDMHYKYFWGEYALVARVMAQTYPKLNIIDATWTSALTNYKYRSSTTYPTNKLIISTDPVAASWYAAKYILYPLSVYPNDVDPNNPYSVYGRIIRRWARYLSDSAGIKCTLDSSLVSVYNHNSWTHKTYLDISPIIDSVGPSSGSLSYSVESNLDWKVYVDVPWMAVVKDNDSTLTVEVEKNEHVKYRSGTIIVRFDEVNADSAILFQEGSQPFLEVSPFSRTVSPEPGSANFLIHSNEDWLLYVDLSWIISVNYDSSTVKINFDQNFSTLSRSGEIIIRSSSGIMDTIFLVQSGAEGYLFVSPSESFIGARFDSISFTVDSNMDWEIIEDFSWISVDKEDDQNLLVYVEENTDSQDRFAEIIFIAQGNAKFIVSISQSGTDPNYISTAGMDEYFAIYPNPAVDRIFINPRNNYYRKTLIELQTITGEVILQQELENLHSGEIQMLDITSLKSGIYILQISNAEFQRNSIIVKFK